MPANERTRTGDLTGSTVEEAVGDREVIVVSIREPYSHEYDAVTDDHTDWIERVFESIAIEPRTESPVSEEVHARGD